MYLRPQGVKVDGDGEAAGIEEGNEEKLWITEQRLHLVLHQVYFSLALSVPASLYILVLKV